LRRIFEAQWGISPLQYLQTRRLLAAKHLLTDTQLPITQVAALSGFASIRRFNAVFGMQYRVQPRALRSAGAVQAMPSEGIRIKAAYRPPLDAAHLFGFFARRAIPGVEHVEAAKGSYVRTLCWTQEKLPLSGWVHAQLEPARHSVIFRISPSLAPALAALLPQLRAWLDLEADPQAIDDVLGSAFPACAGMRVPGTLDGFELAVRAILGQQITVQAARTLTQRLVERYGTPVVTPWPTLNRCFPTATQLSVASAEDLGALGIVRQRQGALLALARAVEAGQLALHPGAEVAATMEALQSLPGVGPWTANYIAMRALRWPDAFPSGDVALQKALGVQEAKNPAKAAELASQHWQPWRSYAVVRAWNSLS
jgi:AraC family transcriptional regulator of adaptative response / DNA-3-methyladenine glycosylase II